MNKIVLSTFFSFLLTTQLMAQSDNQTVIKRNIVIDGTLCLTTDGNAAYFNMGGVNFRLSYNHTFDVMLSMFPSLGIRSEKIWTNGYYKNEIRATPFLGLGPQVAYKRIIFSFPFYYKADKRIWVATAGIGYKVLITNSK